MAVTPNSIITPQAAFTSFSNLMNQTAITSRAPTSTLTNFATFVTTGQNLNGLQIYSITVKGASTSITAATASNIVTVWEYDGTTNHWPVKEIEITAVTPSTTVPAFTTTVEFDRWIIAPGRSLYTTVSVTTATATTALMAYLQGATL